MGILETAIPAIVICTRDRARATEFYRDTLGLALAYEDKFAAVFNIGGVTLRVSLWLISRHTNTEYSASTFRMWKRLSGLFARRQHFQYLRGLQSERTRHPDSTWGRCLRGLVQRSRWQCAKCDECLKRRASGYRRGR